ncbi:MAG: penicillin acylase family protein [Actinobacteria bacterium]|nr:penicillin acylase family protein [Actinomycetota bacterium]
MQEIEEKEQRIKATKGEITVRRNEHGIPVIVADDFPDALYGMGLAQACDRGMQMELTRLVARGQMSENLPPNENFLAMDRTMRKYDIWGFSCKQEGMLEEDAREEMEAFCRGVNDQFAQDPPAEFGLIGYVPQPWTTADCIAIGKIMSIVDMDETQGWIRKVIVQMIQKGVTPAMLAEIFTYMTEDPDEEYLEKLRKVKMPDPYVPETVRWAVLPRERTSSHWMIAGSRTATGKAILCGSPELDSARLPALWQEIFMRVGDFYCMGVYIPGIPLRRPWEGRTTSPGAPPTAAWTSWTTSWKRSRMANTGAAMSGFPSRCGRKRSRSRMPSPLPCATTRTYTGCWRENHPRTVTISVWPSPTGMPVPLPSLSSAATTAAVRWRSPWTTSLAAMPSASTGAWPTRRVISATR